MGAIARALPRPDFGFLPSGPVLRRRLAIVLVLVAALAAAYHFWFRDSKFVAVDTVSVSGVEERPDLASKLESAALEQTTLHIDEPALAAVIAGDPAVRGVTATPDFPHALSIDVDLRDPIAYVPAAGVIVAGDGVILDHADDRPENMAVIDVEDAKTDAGRTLEGNALSVAQTMGPVPPPLLEKVDSARMDAEYGVVVSIGDGIELRFGDRTDTALKWRAAAAVLADPKLDTAAYIDLSVPDRPVVGGLPADPEAVPEG